MRTHKQVTDYPYIEFTVRAYDTRDRGEGGLLSFVFASTDVSDDDVHLGFIGGGLGTVVISISGADKPYFQILHKDLWNAIQEVMEAQDAGLSKETDPSI